MIPERADRRFATFVAMTIATVSVTLGDLLMSQAMRGLGPLRLDILAKWWEGRISLTVSQLVWGGLNDVYGLLWRIFVIPKVWLAIACMLMFLVLWMVSLSWSDLTYVMPLTALTYVLNALLVGPVLGEHVTLSRWMGTLLIAVGVALVTIERPPRETS